MAELFVDEGLSDAEDVLQLARSSRVKVQHVSTVRLTQLCHASHHQGLAARMGDFPYRDDAWLQAAVQSAADQADRHGPPPLVVVCDRIQDTHNFGAILRTCDAVAALAVVIGTEQQAGVSPQVSRSSAGAVNHVPVVASESLTGTIERLSQAGVRITAASEKANGEHWSADLRGPVCLIVGSEASGVCESLLQKVDCGLRIPMLGQVGSLNAAVAAGIVLYEIRRQQGRTGPHDA